MMDQEKITISGFWTRKPRRLSNASLTSVSTARDRSRFLGFLNAIRFSQPRLCMPAARESRCPRIRMDGRINPLSGFWNGRGCSPGCCIVQTATASSTLPPVRALRASRITTSAPNIKIARRIISARMCCGSWRWNEFRRSTSTSAVMWRAFRRNGCITAAPIRNGTSGKIRSAWSRQESALPILMWSCPGSMRITLSARSVRKSIRN